MNIRRVVTATHSIDLQVIENENAVVVTDLAAEKSLTFTTQEFHDFIDLGGALRYFMVEATRRPGEDEKPDVGY